MQLSISSIKRCHFFQLNDVASGGRTVFPRVGAGVAPVANAAVFWYNLFTSSDPDRLTLHGACPVLYGTKWGKCHVICNVANKNLISLSVVSNKWIREGAQVFSKPCDLERKTKHDYE